MKRTVIAIFLLINITFKANAQDFASYLKQNAVEIQQLDSLPNNVFDLLKNYKLIMIGEMHGTNEPAQFVVGLADLFARHGNTVQVGFEIPNKDMSLFLEQHTDKSILESDFFRGNRADGRASVAWAKAIAELSKKNIHVFFYDAEGDLENRDSAMYLNIKQQIKNNPTRVTITLSGNIHNMLLPYKNEKKAALYLKEDTELNLKNSFCSLNHIYQYGTMLNNLGKGLELHTITEQKSIFSELNYDKYLLTYPMGTPNIYNGTFFTRKVTASTLVETE